MINLIFPLELSVRPPGPIEGFIREVSVNELLECDLVAGWRLQAQPQQEVRTLLALCYGFQGAPEMLMKLFCRHGDWRGPPGSVVIIIIIIIIIDIIIQGSVLRLQQGGQPGDRPGRGRQQRGGKEQSHGRGPVHGTGDGGTAGLFLYPASSIYLEWSFPNLSDFYFVPRLVPACPMCPCSDERTTTFTLSLSLVTCFRTHNEDIQDIELEKDYQLAINLLPLC